MKCPKCHRDTYSAKWGTCTACGLSAPREDVSVTLPVTKRVTPTVTAPPVVTPERNAPLPGVTPSGAHACPVCGMVHGGGRSNAERQRAYRARSRPA